MISVVVPYYNERGSIVPLLERICATLDPAPEGYEVLVVDNGSSPAEETFLLDQRPAFPALRVVRLSRNFGYQGALWAGLDHALGDPVVFIDGDGEDPPELIATFLEKWREGYDVVYGVRASRQVSWYLDLMYRIFYRLLARLSDVHIPLDAGEFSLVSGKALKALASFQDRTRMMRILRAWVGFRQLGVTYHRQSRIAGASKFGLLRSVSFAWDGFVSATDLPVVVAIYSGLFCFGLGVVGSIYYVFWYFFGSEAIPGFASLNITILFLFSMMFASFATLARYTMTLLHEARRRPPYLVQHDTRVEPAPRLPPNER